MRNRGIFRSAAVIWLAAMVFLAVFRDVIANERPLVCRIEGQTFCPGLRNIWADPQQAFQHKTLENLRLHESWHTHAYEFSLFAPIPFSPGVWNGSVPADRLSPGAVHPVGDNRFRHWLGTDAQGRDVAAGLVGGARLAICTGLLASGISMLLGVVLGSITGYWGDRRLRISRASLLMAVLCLLLCVLYAMVWRHTVRISGLMVTCVFILLCAVGTGGSMLWKRLSVWAAGTVPLPVDLLIMRCAEILDAVPRIVAIVALAALLPGQTIWALIALIGCISWTAPAQLLRAELLKIRDLEYVQAAETAGIGPLRILWRHALPNALQSLVVMAVFSIAGAILLEASLSFLGFGGEQFKGVSWGSLLSIARKNPADWWVAVFPGLMIGLTLLSLYKIGLQREAHLI